MSLPLKHCVISFSPMKVADPFVFLFPYLGQCKGETGLEMADVLFGHRQAMMLWGLRNRDPGFLEREECCALCADTWQ